MDNKQVAPKKFTSLSTIASTTKHAPHSTFYASKSTETAHICHICANTPTHWSVTECNHRTCSTCSLRLRALYESKQCPLCKTDSESVLITTDYDRTFKLVGGSQTQSSIISGVWYESNQVLKEVEAIFQFKCSTCSKVFKDKQLLKRHLSSDHKLTLCDICLKDKKVFPCELQAFANHRDLLLHQRQEHPTCPACHTIFYGEDELSEHCRQKHELCHLCDRARRAAPLIPSQISTEERRTLESERASHLASLANAPYYLDYLALETHFARQHFLCTEPLCRELKFVVFASELELRAHQVDMHGTGPIRLQRSQQQQLRRLDVSFRRPTNPAVTTTVRVSDSSGAPSGEAPSQRVPQPAATPHVISTIFGPVPGDLTKRLQTLSLLETRNQDLLNSLNSLNLQPNVIALVQKSCQDYQKNAITADELIRRLDSWIGYQRLHGGTSSREQRKQVPPMRMAAWQPVAAIKKQTEGDTDSKDAKGSGGLFEKFLDVQADDFKARELRHALEQHVYKQTSFPSLLSEGIGTTAHTTGASTSSPGPLKQKHMQLDKPAVLRLKPRTSTHIPPGVDVSKNPAWLAGGIGSAATTNVKKKVKPKPAAQPPPLPEERAARQASTSRPVTDTITDSMEGDTFVIGGEVPTPLMLPTHPPDNAAVQPGGTTNGAGKKKNKGKVVLLRTGMQRSA